MIIPYHRWKLSSIFLFYVVGYPMYFPTFLTFMPYLPRQMASAIRSSIKYFTLVIRRVYHCISFLLGRIGDQISEKSIIEYPTCICRIFNFILIHLWSYIQLFYFIHLMSPYCFHISDKNQPTFIKFEACSIVDRLM